MKICLVHALVYLRHSADGGGLSPSQSKLQPSFPGHYCTGYVVNNDAIIRRVIVLAIMSLATSATVVLT